MYKFYKLLIVLSVIYFSNCERGKAQCHVIDSLVFGYMDPNGAGYFNSFLCAGMDSVGTEGPYGYYNGDSYFVNLIMGSDVIFSIDSCNGNPVSMTISDSLMNIIPGAYESAGCPNSLNFTPPYTGKYYLTLNINSTCNVIGNTRIGQSSVKIDPGSSPPDCPVGSVVNDTICGAIPLTLNGSFIRGNSALAYVSDPLDNYVSSVMICSPPNNTLWYSFTPSFDMDTVAIWLTSDQGSGFHSWLAVFTANDSVNVCNGSLFYIGCEEGPDEANGIDTVVISLFGLQYGYVYYFMIDGYNGAMGEFSIALRNSTLNTSILQFDDTFFSVYPNPASRYIRLKSLLKEASVSIYNSLGQEVLFTELMDLSNAEVDVSDLTSGLYIVHVKSDAGMFSRKLLINR